MACKNRGLIEKRIRNCVGEEILLCFAGDGLAGGFTLSSIISAASNHLLSWCWGPYLGVRHYVQHCGTLWHVLLRNITSVLAHYTRHTSHLVVWLSPEKPQVNSKLLPSCLPPVVPPGFPLVVCCCSVAASFVMFVMLPYRWLHRPGLIG